jgi:hypothetical protein
MRTPTLETGTDVRDFFVEIVARSPQQGGVLPSLNRTSGGVPHVLS